MKDNLLSFAGDSINYLIYLFIFIGVIRSGTFNTMQLSISLFGVVVNIIINLYNTFVYNGRNK